MRYLDSCCLTPQLKHGTTCSANDLMRLLMSMSSTAGENGYGTTWLAFDEPRSKTGYFRILEYSL